ncbi:hypothetical protein BHE74_00038867 [Ensete ventricosum]|nr:hypothetical protein BHE74_00038867 [Ensete ventricosum]
MGLTYFEADVKSISQHVKVNLLKTFQNLEWLVLDQELEHAEKQVNVIQKHLEGETVEMPLEFDVETER